MSDDDIYLTTCILPSESTFYKSESSFVRVEFNQYNALLNDKTNIKVMIDNEIKTITLNELGGLFSFTYTNHLMFLSKSDLFNSSQWELSNDNDNNLHILHHLNDSALISSIRKGFITSSLLIKPVATQVTSDHVGYGLYTTEAIVGSETFIGEYTGVIFSGIKIIHR